MFQGMAKDFSINYDRKNLYRTCHWKDVKMFFFELCCWEAVTTKTDKARDRLYKNFFRRNDNLRPIDRIGCGLLLTILM
jgi:hypothetical protein